VGNTRTANYIIFKIKLEKICYDRFEFLAQKYNGCQILDVPNPYSLFRIIKYVFKQNEKLRDITHLIFWTPGSLKAILFKTGIELIVLNTKLSNKYIPNFFIKGLVSHLRVVAK
jgi:hypothetical protein